VLGVQAVGKDLTEATSRAYAAVGRIKFKGMHFRKDIGRKALARR
jgi:phosphoribosylamine--glycine ligase